METQNFNLQQAIAQYFSSIKQNGNITEDDEKELLSHLYETIDSLQKNGLTEEESFFIAVKRLGKTDLLAEEYNKLNPVMQPQIIWAYLFIGFGVITSAIWIFSILYQLFYRFIQNNLSNTGFGLFLFITLNLIVCIGAWLIMLRGRKLTKKLEKAIEKSPWALTWIVFLLPTANVLFYPLISHLRLKLNIDDVMFIHPDDIFRYGGKGGWANLSYYLLLVCFLIILLLSIVQASKKQFNTENLLSDTPFSLLIILSVFLELIAATTRAIPIYKFGFIHYIIFGIVYVIASYTITHFNNKKILFKILVLISFGLTMELVAGIIADKEQGSNRTPYFVSALIAGTIIGYLSAKKIKKDKVLLG